MGIFGGPHFYRPINKMAARGMGRDLGVDIALRRKVKRVKNLSFQIRMLGMRRIKGQQCGKCGLGMKGESHYCRRCGMRVLDAVSNDFSIQAAKAAFLVPGGKCGQCGARVLADYNYCSKCGTMIIRRNLKTGVIIKRGAEDMADSMSDESDLNATR